MKLKIIKEIIFLKIKKIKRNAQIMIMKRIIWQRKILIIWKKKKRKIMNLRIMMKKKKMRKIFILKITMKIKMILFL